MDCYANRRAVYYFLLAVNSDLTAIFSRFGDITSIHRTSLPAGTEKDGWD